MAELPTDGMSYDGDGFVGSVGVVAFPKQDIEKGDYQSNSSSLNELKETVSSMMSMSPTDLLSSANLANKIKLLDIQATIDSAKLIEQSNILLAKVITNSGLASSLVIQENGSNDVLMQGVTLSAIQEQTKAIEAQTTAIKAQKLELNADSLSMGNINIDTASIVDKLNDGVSAQKEISKHLEETLIHQKETSAKIVENLAKQNESLDFQKNGKTDLKDSDGNVIKPQEVQARNNAEQLIDKESVNKTTIEEIMEFNQDVRQFLDENSVESVFSDAVGSTDGFVENLNPFKFFDDILKETFEEEINPKDK